MRSMGQPSVQRTRGTGVTRATMTMTMTMTLAATNLLAWPKEGVLKLGHREEKEGEDREEREEGD